MTGTIYSGILPVVPTTFTETGDLDLESQRRALDCIVDQGVDGACILANFSEQFLLTDEERDTLLAECLKHVAGRIPIIVTCSHFSTQIAVERAKRAEATGAAMVMMMPPKVAARARRVATLVASSISCFLCTSANVWSTMTLCSLPTSSLLRLPSWLTSASSKRCAASTSYCGKRAQ